jgi:hypothetical protein
MAEKDEVNVVELLMDIQQRLAKVETNTSGINHTTKRADDAYTLAKQNEEDIKTIKSNSQWWTRTMWVAVVLPIALFIVENFMM